MDKDHHELQKRDSITTNGPIKINTRTKRTRREENLTYVDQNNTQQVNVDLVDLEIDMGNSSSVEVDMANANKYLDTLLTKITKKLMSIELYDDAYERLKLIECGKSIKMSVDIVFSPNRGRKLVFNKRAMDEIKRKINKDNFEAYVSEKFDGIRTNILKAIYVYYADFVEAIDKTINDIFFHFKMPYNNEFFKAYYSSLTEGIETYKQRKLEDINYIYSVWPELRLNVDRFPRYPLQTRKYHNIDNYESALEKNKEENINGIYNLENLLKSDVKPRCDNKCCCSQSMTNFCKISQYRDHWETGCTDKKSNIECDDSCGCKYSCKNRALQTNNTRKLAQNVDIKLCWGIDLATRQSICLLMPAYLNFEGQRHYMDKILNTLNDFGYEGWNITNCFELLVEKASKALKDYKSSQKRNSVAESKCNNNSHDFEILLFNEGSNSTCNSQTVNNMIDRGDDIIAHIDKAFGHEFRRADTLIDKLKNINNDPYNMKENSQSLRSIIGSHLSNPYVNHIKNMSDLQQLEQELEVYTVLLKHSKISQLRAALRVHSKGLGVVCKKQSGIEKNSLVVKYIGEVYPVWYWCMKQDVIKTFFAMVKKDKVKKFSQYKNNYNMDFYNIMLEKNIKEPKGRDIVVVDPIIKGNFASRLSHSCNPNCMAFPVISNGQYAIAMYAIRDISYQEELTFDYCSITESEQEYKNSVCLCGTLDCKGHYLGFTKKHLEFFTGSAKKYLIDDASNSFLRSNANILQACETKYSDKKKSELMKFCIGENTFKNSPEWLKNWSYYVLQTIKREKRGLIKELLGVDVLDNENEIRSDIKLDDKQTQIKYEVDTLFSQRVNNLIISIDKIRHFMMRQMPELRTQKPLQLLTLDQQIDYISDILEALISITDIESSLHKSMEDYVNDKVNNEHAMINSFVQYTNDVKLVRLIRGKVLLLELSFKLKSKNKAYINRENKDSHVLKAESLRALSDIIYLIAFTVVCFTSNSYEGFSLPIDVRECDLTSAKRTFTLNTKSEEEQLQNLIKPITTLDK